MALDTNNWTSREQHKASEQRYILSDSIPANQQHHHQRNQVKIPSKVSILTQTEHTNRFTQTDQSPGNGYSINCLEASGHKEAAMFDPGIHQQVQGHQQIYSSVQPGTVDKKDSAEKIPTVEFPFCYNVLQKVPAGTAAGTAVGPDDKGCYRFEVTQPFSYNYALVNQMSLAAAASTAQFKCDVCGLVFAHLSLLNHHKRIHNTSERFTCELCGAIFGQAVELKAHKQSEHSKKCCNSCGTEVICEHGKKKAKYVKCVNCQEEENTFHGEILVPDMEAESKEHHPVKRRNMGQVTKCHKCNGSGIIFVGGSRTTVDKPFHCNLCDGTFSRYSSLWSHKRLHSGDKPFKCELCGVTFAKAAYLKNHQRVHTGEKPFKCPVCGMQFSQSPHLKNHERIHSGERPYQCEVCEKTFARHSTLWNHRRIHTGEKPYRCEICASAFNQATHLKNHAKVHTGEKPYRCDICEVGFSDRFALKRHRNIHEKYGRIAPNSDTQEENNQQQGRQPCIEDMYKCDISTNIAFPGCLSSDDKNSECLASRARQPVIDELYKCEVGTNIAFPGCSRPRDKNSECGTIEAK